MFNEDVRPLGAQETVVLLTPVDKNDRNVGPFGFQKGLKTLQCLSECKLLNTLKSTDFQVWMLTSKV